MRLNTARLAQLLFRGYRLIIQYTGFVSERELACISLINPKTCRLQSRFDFGVLIQQRGRVLLQGFAAFLQLHESRTAILQQLLRTLESRLDLSYFRT